MAGTASAKSLSLLRKIHLLFFFALLPFPSSLSQKKLPKKVLKKYRKLYIIASNIKLHIEICRPAHKRRYEKKVGKWLERR